jgi:hypothetical protein
VSTATEHRAPLLHRVAGLAIVTLPTAMMIPLPMHLPKSSAHARVATVGFATTATLFVTPAANTLLGNRLDASCLRRHRAAGSVETTLPYRRAHGIARTGRVVTAAAVVMSISFGALIAAEVAFMRMFGLGLALAVLADATLIRMALMPAFMHAMGAWNWWAPSWLTRVHDRIGLDHGDQPGSTIRPTMSDNELHNEVNRVGTHVVTKVKE